MSPTLAMQWSSTQVTQWREVQKVNRSNARYQQLHHQDILLRWKPPEVGVLKVNVDASVYAGRSSFSVGMVLRDHAGRFCRARNFRRMGEVYVFEAEAEGVLAALKWIVEHDIANVEIESDSVLTVQALRKDTQNLLEVGNILQESRLLLQARPDIRVFHIKKQANKVAHLLARVHCEANCLNEFFSPQQAVLESIMYDATYA